MNNNKPIAVFDSGVGGITVLAELWKLMPNENYIYYGDSQNAPYGTKPEAQIKEFTEKNIINLIAMGAKAVVIACNTATSVAANDLREKFDIPIIGIEPAVKPAATAHKGKKVVVMATPMTLKKEKFINLMESYNDMSEIIPLPCPDLVEIIERGITEGYEINEYLQKLFGPFNKDEISAVVLGCTHYPFIKKAIDTMFGGNVDIIDGGYGTAKETKRRLCAENLENGISCKGHITFLSSKECQEEIELMKSMFNLLLK